MYAHETTLMGTGVTIDFLIGRNIDIRQRKVSMHGEKSGQTMCQQILWNDDNND